MSQSLVRRGLDLFKDDIKTSAHCTRSRRTTSSSTASDVDAAGQTKKNMNSERNAALHSTNKEGYRRRLNRLHKKINSATLKNKKVTASQEIYANHTRRDKTEENVKALQFLGLLNKDDKASQLLQDSKKCVKKKGQQTVKENKEQTAFTEQDFQKFFSEYNFS